MKILVINKYWYDRGGADVYAHWLARELQGRGHEVCVFSVDHPRNELDGWNAEVISGVDTENRTVSKIPKTIGRVFWSFEAQKKLRAFIEREQPDVAHVHNVYTQMSPSIFPVLQSMGVPVVATVHDYGMTSANYSLFDAHGIDRLGSWWSVVKRRGLQDSLIASAIGATAFQLHKWMRVYPKGVDRMLFTSEFVMRLFAARRWSGDPGAVLPLPFELPGDFELRITNNELDPYLLFAGRLHKTKGVHVLIEAARKTGLPVRIVGDGPDMETLREQAGAMTNITFVGRLSREDTLREMAGARAVVVPSIWWEPFGLVALEPQALGVPVIASRTGGLTEVVVHGQTGLQVEAGDVEQLAAAMRRLWNNPDEAKKMGQMGRRRVATQYKPEDHVDAIELVYEQLKKSK